MRISGLLVALLLAGCGSSPAGTSPDVPGETELRIEVDAGDGSAPRRWTLRCDPPGGDHPDPAGACRALEAARAPFAPVPAGALCTQVYGGPQTARISGTWRGEQVDARYSRTDGCEIARWDAVATVLQEPGGVTGR